MHREIITDRLVLRILEERDDKKLLDYYLRNKDFLEEWEMVKDDSFYTIENMSDMIIQDIERFNAESRYKYYILIKGREDRFIGSVALDNIVRGCFQSCFMGYRLDQDEINRGYMTEAVKALVEFGFKTLKLHRIEANIMPKNHPSLKVVEKVGFYNEGLAKKYLCINGEWEDHIHMVILNEEMHTI